MLSRKKRSAVVDPGFARLGMRASTWNVKKSNTWTVGEVHKKKKKKEAAKVFAAVLSNE